MLSRRDLRELSLLEGRDFRDLAAAFLLVPLVSSLLGLRGLRYVRARVEPRPAASREPPSELTLERMKRLPRWISIASRRGPWRSSCLVRSLALQWMLTNHRVPSALRLGVRKEGESLDAHAWVECPDLPGLDPNARRDAYAPFLAAGEELAA